MRPGAAFLPVALLVVASPLGCSKATGGTLFASFADLNPDASPGTRAQLLLGNPKKGKGEMGAIQFEVDLKHEKRDKTVSIDLIAQNETFERELYETASDAFRIVSTTEDSFAPAIDIVRFPAQDGGTWEWSGKVSYAGISRPAKATILLKKEGTGLSSEITLKIQADQARPDLRRTLKFWFEKDKGVVRRSFGEVSTRLPVGDTWLP